MPNLRGYTATIVAGSFSSAHDINYNGQVVDDHGNILGDFTSSPVSLLTQLNLLNAAQGQAFADMCASFLLRIKFPSAWG